jgi:signal transduction histidine kinase
MRAYSPEKGFFIIIFKDITDKELNRIKLEESENSKSQLLKNLTDGFAHCELVYDDNGDAIDYRILDVNPIYEIQTGIPAKDIIGKKARDIFPTMKSVWIKICADVALKQKTHSFVDHNSTTNKYYETNAYSPKIGEFALIYRDVTARENKRVLLEKAYVKASENEKLKSAFLANMSHEIRTPMNAILGCSALLENDDLAREESLRCLSHIKSSGNRLLSIISDIVDISKIDAQQQTLNFAEHDLNDILTRLKAQFNVTNIKPNISLVFDKGLIDGESTIYTDETKLIQILSNLLENAFKFTEKGQIRFGYKLNGAFLNFYVKDSGIGIKQEDCPKVFERFRQVLNTKTKINSGSGLGISICKGLVELFGGEITLESEFGKGSTFHFTLPYLPMNKV